MLINKHKFYIDYDIPCFDIDTNRICSNNINYTLVIQQKALLL